MFYFFYCIAYSHILTKITLKYLYFFLCYIFSNISFPSIISILSNCLCFFCAFCCLSKVQLGNLKKTHRKYFFFLVILFCSLLNFSLMLWWVRKENKTLHSLVCVYVYACSSVLYLKKETKVWSAWECKTNIIFSYYND